MNLLEDIILWEIGLCDDHGRVLPDRHPLALQIRTCVAHKLADALRAAGGRGEGLVQPEPRIVELVRYAASCCEPYEDSLEETVRAVRWAVDLHRRLRAIPDPRVRGEKLTNECAEVEALLRELSEGIRAYDEACRGISALAPMS